MEIFREFTIEAAHRLPDVPADHACGRLHGHSFRVQVWIQGEVGRESGWIMDFGVLDEAFRPVHQQLDHRYLNEVAGLENPTSENLARWIWRELEPSLPGLSKITIQETTTTGCVYRGPSRSR